MSLLDIFRRKCKHEFALTDLKKTGIPQLEKSVTASYKEWEQYYHDIYTHDSHTKRVVWPCAKCGEIFYAHCGLDIYQYGTPQRIVHVK